MATPQLKVSFSDGTATKYYKFVEYAVPAGVGDAFTENPWLEISGAVTWDLSAHSQKTYAELSSSATCRFMFSNSDKYRNYNVDHAFMVGMDELVQFMPSTRQDWADIRKYLSQS